MKTLIIFVFVILNFGYLSSQSYSFTDINAGLTGVSQGSAAWGDYDNDGDLDVIITGSIGSSPISKIYRNDNNTFTNINANIWPVGENSSVAWGDYDNDGDLDLLLTGYNEVNNSRVATLYNYISGQFNAVANFPGVNYPSVAWGDYDNDGFIDFILTGSTTTTTRISSIYHNGGNGTFTNINAGLTAVNHSSVAWGDYDNDGFLDLILTGDAGSTNVSKIYRNNGNSTFTDIAANLTGVYQSSVAWGDYDNDGDLDILLTGYSSAPISKIYQNNNGVFTYVNYGLQIMDRSSVSWGDYDNDGDLDILMSGQNYNSNRYTLVYSNNIGSFTSVNTGLPQITDSSVSWGDYDNDGDLDILLTGYTGSARISRIYNNSGGTNRWLKVKTRGIYSNADGLGCRITVLPNRKIREISSGGGCVNRIAHFGLGSQTTLDTLKIYWPSSGLTDVRTQVQSNQSIVAYENSNPPTVHTITITPNPAKAGTVTCTAMFTANSGGLNYSFHPTLWFTSANGTVGNFTETSYSANQWIGWAMILSTTQNGTATVHVTGVTDNYNNIMPPNHNAGSFVIDTVAPTVSSIVVNPQITNVRTDLTVQVNFTELTAGLNSNISPVVTIIPLGASASGYINVTQTGYNAVTRIWSGVASITAQTPEGLAAIKVASAADLAGNVMQMVTLQNQLTVDRSAPLAFIILQPEEGSWTANRQPTISWSPSSDAVSGLSHYTLSINDNLVGGDIPPTTTSVTLQTPLPDAGYSLRVTAYDNSDSTNTRMSGTAPTMFHVDGTAPISVITSPANGTVVPGNSVNITGTASDGIGANAGIGIRYVMLSKDGGAIWDTVYTAPTQNPSMVSWEHTYSGLTPGNYTIAVKAIDWLDNAELSTSSISIIVQAVAPVANFSATPTTGIATLHVVFSDLSIQGSWPITSWLWNFGDGSTGSTTASPTHDYTSHGMYSVSLTVMDAYNTSHTFTMPDLINVLNQAPIVILPLPDLVRDEDFAPIVIDINNHFDDGDGDDLVYSVSIDPPLVTATITNSNLTISSIPNVSGSVNVTITADDQYPPPSLVSSSTAQRRAIISDTFLLLINPVNDAPTIDLPDSFTFAEDGSLEINLASLVEDVDNATLTLSASGNDSVTVAITGLNVTLGAMTNWNGTEQITFTVNDNAGKAIASDTADIVVTPVNDAPVIVSYIPTQLTIDAIINDILSFSITATDIDSNVGYGWKINEIDQDNPTNAFTHQFSQSGTYTVTAIVSDEDYTVEQSWTVNIPVANDDDHATPIITKLYQNYPNPFNPETNIKFSVKNSGWVKVSVLNSRGQLVSILQNGLLKSGQHTIVWNGLNNNGNKLSSGIYYIKMESDKGVEIHKATLMK